MTTKQTPEELIARVEKTWEKTTGGVWGVALNGNGHRVVVTPLQTFMALITSLVPTGMTEGDAQAIANSRTDIVDLVSALKEAEENARKDEQIEQTIRLKNDADWRAKVYFQQLYGPKGLIPENAKLRGRILELEKENLSLIDSAKILIKTKPSGCACKFDEDEETILSWCAAHAEWKERVRKLEADRDLALKVEARNFPLDATLSIDASAAAATLEFLLKSSEKENTQLKQQIAKRNALDPEIERKLAWWAHRVEVVEAKNARLCEREAKIIAEMEEEIESTRRDMQGTHNYNVKLLKHVGGLEAENIQFKKEAAYWSNLYQAESKSNARLREALEKLLKDAQEGLALVKVRQKHLEAGPYLIGHSAGKSNVWNWIIVMVTNALTPTSTIRKATDAEMRELEKHADQINGVVTPTTVDQMADHVESEETKYRERSEKIGPGLFAALDGVVEEIERDESEEVTGQDLQKMIDDPDYRKSIAVLAPGEIDDLMLGKNSGESPLDNCTTCGHPYNEHADFDDIRSCQNAAAEKRNKPTEVE